MRDIGLIEKNDEAREGDGMKVREGGGGERMMERVELLTWLSKLASIHSNTA